MLMISWRNARVCGDCGQVFAYRWPAQRYCSGCSEARSPRPAARVRRINPIVDAEAALLELRAWMAEQGVKA